jgi:hypothetical protein
VVKCACIPPEPMLYAQLRHGSLFCAVSHDISQAEPLLGALALRYGAGACF